MLTRCRCFTSCSAAAHHDAAQSDGQLFVCSSTAPDPTTTWILLHCANGICPPPRSNTFPSPSVSNGYLCEGSLAQTDSRFREVTFHTFLTIPEPEIADVSFANGRHVPSMLMATMDSVSADASTRRGILTVLHRLASSPSSAVYLVEHAGILSWLRLQFASDVVWQVPAKPDQAADPIPKTAIRLHDVADDQSLVTEGACGEGEAVAEVEIITELLLQLSWNLPAHRPDFALEEMILAVSQLLRSFAHVSSPCCPLTIPFVFAVPSDAQL